MERIEDKADLRKNMTTLDSYLDKKVEPNYGYAIGLIEKGKCLIAVKTKDGFRFYPSRFMGYAGNSKNNHEMNNEKDGRYTNSWITRVLEKKREVNPALLQTYYDYCLSIGGRILKTGSDRKFWEVDLEDLSV